MNIEKVTQAINADAGFEIPGLGESLAEMKAGKKGRVTTASQVLIREARGVVGYTQPKFARAIGTSVTSLRDWEQGRHEPPAIASKLMRVIKKHPKLIHELEAEQA